MTCQCICRCTNEAGDNIEPKLCTMCRLCEDIDESAAPAHGLPYTPASVIKLDPLAPLTNEEKDAELQHWVAENGF